MLSHIGPPTPNLLARLAFLRGVDAVRPRGVETRLRRDAADAAGGFESYRDLDGSVARGAPATLDSDGSLQRIRIGFPVGDKIDLSGLLWEHNLTKRG